MSSIGRLGSSAPALFVIFDQLFGTYKKLGPNDSPVFGVTTPIETRNPLKVVYRSGVKVLWEDLREAPDWAIRLNILWRRPAWYSVEYKRKQQLLGKQAPVQISAGWGYFHHQLPVLPR